MSTKLGWQRRFGAFEALLLLLTHSSLISAENFVLQSSHSSINPSFSIGFFDICALTLNFKASIFVQLRLCIHMTIATLTFLFLSLIKVEHVYSAHQMCHICRHFSEIFTLSYLISSLCKPKTTRWTSWRHYTLSNWIIWSPGGEICTVSKPFIGLCWNWANSPKASKAFAVEYAALSSLRWTQIWPCVSQICCNYHCQHNYLCPRVWSRQLWFIWKTWPTLTEYVINNLQRFVFSDVKLVETHMVDLSRH